MLSKNNKQEKLRKLEEKNNHFAIRKLTVGVASVLIGLTFMGVSNNHVEAATNDNDQASVATTNINPKAEVESSNPQKDDTQADPNTPVSSKTSATAESNKSTQAQDTNKAQVPNTPSNEAVENAPAVKGVGTESNGQQIDNIHSIISVTATNKYTGQTSSSSANTVQVNEPVAKDLDMVLTLTNDTDQEQKINTTWPNNSYVLPAYGGTGAQIVVDPSRVKVVNGEVTFGGNYTDSNVSIASWDYATGNSSSSGFNGSPETKAIIAKNPELIGGFSTTGTLKAKETVTIIVPLKVVDTQKQLLERVQKQYGQEIKIQVSPENFRDANDYTDTNLTVDGLTDGNISNLAENNGELTVSGQITNNGFISHDESLVFNLSSVGSADNHKVQTVLDHDKAIQLDWNNTTNDNISYYVNGTYKTADQMTDSDWNHVTMVKVDASLQSGQTGKVTIPVKLSNLDQIESDLQNVNDIGPSNNRLNTISLSAKSDNSDLKVTNGSVSYYSELPAYAAMKAIEDEINGKGSITPMYLVIDEDGNRSYEPIADISIPQLGKDYFTYVNIGHKDPSSILFTDGYYTIKLDKIFDAAKDHGFSVNISNNNGQEAAWPTYYYQAFSANKADQIDLYTQLQQIFNTKDLTLMAGDSWNSNDSLVSANIDFYTLNFSDYFGTAYDGNKDLKATGDYTYDLYDANGNQIDKDVPVGQNVPTLAMGTYKVVYHYQINKDEVVSKAATIIVNGSTSGDPLTQPDKPEFQGGVAGIPLTQPDKPEFQGGVAGIPLTQPDKPEFQGGVAGIP
ncbi:YSIRK-type signal peptide-containing protein, partial [Lactobacillus agrestimuris]|uniref:YSIRK-type signal peptide-containing protein n=1 Tax=Lactobacillus agrestimuris TaxID=2941328 RepID=UPI0020449986